MFLHSPGKYNHDTDVPGNAISVSQLNLPEASLGHMRLNLNSVFDFPVARIWGLPPSFSQDPGLRLQYRRVPSEGNFCRTPLPSDWGLIYKWRDDGEWNIHGWHVCACVGL